MSDVKNFKAEAIRYAIIRTYKPDDIQLLCTDGLWRSVDEAKADNKTIKLYKVLGWAERYETRYNQRLYLCDGSRRKDVHGRIVPIVSVVSSDWFGVYGLEAIQQ